MLDQKQFASALKQVCDEKGLQESQVIETIESALAAAYRKDYGNKLQNIKVEFNPENGDTKIYDVKTVVEDLPEEEKRELEEKTESEGEEKEKKIEMEEKKAEPKSIAPEEASHSEALKDGEEVKKFNPKTEIQLSDAKKIKKTAKIGDEIITKLEQPEGYGRMAAQTAKQVIIQKLREAERNTIYDETKDKEGKVVNGVIQRYERGLILVGIGRATAILPHEHQIKNESYNIGSQMKFYVVAVNQTIKGPEIIVSRRNEEILKELFSLEIPEISSGVVEIKGIAREAGERSKVAVFTEDKSIDPIGSCIGQRGNRIQTIINDLNGEKVDIIEYSNNVEKFISNALSPAKISSIKTNKENNIATIEVKADQFSLAIGKGGQNARLAAKLTGWKIDIIEDKSSPADTQPEASAEEETAAESDKKDKETEPENKKETKDKKENKKKDKEDKK